MSAQSLIPQSGPLECSVALAAQPHPLVLAEVAPTPPAVLHLDGVAVTPAGQALGIQATPGAAATISPNDEAGTRRFAAEHEPAAAGFREANKAAVMEQAQAGAPNYVFFLNTTASQVTALTIAGAQAPYGNFPIPAAASGGQPGGPVAALRSQFASGAQIGVTFDTGLTWTQFVTIASAAAPGNFEVWVFWNGFVLADQTGVMLLLSWATSVSS